MLAPMRATVLFKWEAFGRHKFSRDLAVYLVYLGLYYFSVTHLMDCAAAADEAGGPFGCG